jgi:UDP-glucose 6-dehydrogenase
MKVCVIGTGYVGLVTGACLAHIGHHVICVDNNEAKVNLMKSGQSPIFEPGLSDVMQGAIQSGRLELLRCPMVKAIRAMWKPSPVVLVKICIRPAATKSL